MQTMRLRSRRLNVSPTADPAVLRCHAAPLGPRLGQPLRASPYVIDMGIRPMRFLGARARLLEMVATLLFVPLTVIAVIALATRSRSAGSSR